MISEEYCPHGQLTCSNQVALPLWMEDANCRKDSLQIHDCHTPSSVLEEHSFNLSLRTTRFTASLLSVQSNRKADTNSAFVALLKACARNKDLQRGSSLHDAILKQGLLETCSDALVTMYAKCGALAKAESLFDMHKCADVITWNALIAGYAQAGRGRDAMGCFECMQHEGVSPDVATYVSILRVCGTLRALDKGSQIHEEVARQGLLPSEIVLATALTDMYAKCGALTKAQRVLEELPTRNVVSWTTLISGYLQQSQAEQALNCFRCMLHDGILPNAITYACILKACGSLAASDEGKEIHDVIVKQGFLKDDIILGNALVDMYVKCSDLPKAHDVFRELPSRDVISWNTIISGYAQDGQGEQALNCFGGMLYEGILPDAVTYVSILKSCGTIGAVEKGIEIHKEIVKQGLLRNNIVLWNALVDMYAKCGALLEAQQVLEELPSRNVVSWTALITGFVRESRGEEAFYCLQCMQSEGIPPDEITYASILKACGCKGAINTGIQLHGDIARQGLLKNNSMLGNVLVDMYAKCGALLKAKHVFEELPSRDVVSWNSLMAGYTQHGEDEQAFGCFEAMQNEGISPNAVTYATVLKVCGRLRAVEKGKQVHEDISRDGLLRRDRVLGNALVQMYVKCGALLAAHQVQNDLPCRDAVSWNTLIAGYAQQGLGEQALDCLDCMQREGIPPDATTYVSILKACSSIGALHKGEQVHQEILRTGFLQDNTILGNALVDMYAKCGALSRAHSVIEEVTSRNVISWSALIAGYVQEAQGKEALKCFERMQHEGIPPDAVSYACILKACGTVGDIEQGKQIHEKIVVQGLLQNNAVLGSALVDMYAKCGALLNAQCVLEELPCRNVVSWNALIAGYAQQGDEQALHCFDSMECDGILPDAVTFSCVLNVCNHLGLVDKGHEFFVEMNTKYGVKPSLECYIGLIDLFGRAGHLEKAVGVIQQMPSSDYSAIWLVLLGACWKWVDINVGRWAFKHALQLDRCDGLAYVLMENTYAAAGMHEDANSLMAMRTENRTWKMPRHCYWIDPGKEMYAFTDGDPISGTPTSLP